MPRKTKVIEVEQEIEANEPEAEEETEIEAEGPHEIEEEVKPWTPASPPQRPFEHFQQ
jgi:hypothetical protein